MQRSELASYIDHTILKAEASIIDVKQVVEEAVEHRFAAVCVNGVYMKHVVTSTRGTGVATCGVAGFPLGAMKPAVMAIEATSLVKDGADEVDFVAHVPTLLRADYDKAKQQFTDVVKAVRAVLPAVVVKVILETAALMKDATDAEAEKRIEAACIAATESGCDFVKTSTGFHPAGGASVAAVKLMRRYAPNLKVKASGGIRTYDDAMAMIDAGANRLGCSASVAILDGAPA